MPYSHEIYDILKQFRLFCPAPNVGDAVNSLTKEDLVEFSDNIVKFHKKNLALVIDDLEHHRKAFNAYPLGERGRAGSTFLRPLCLYAEKILARDPIYDSLYNPAYVVPNIRAIKDNLIREIPFLIETEPLVRAEILHFVPFMALQAPLVEAIKKSIKTDLESKAWREKIFRNIRYKLYPEQNALFMSLGKPMGDTYHIFRYGKIVGYEKVKDGGLLVKMVSPDSLRDKKFDISDSDISAWIMSEINNEVIRTTNTINENLVLSEALNCSLVTNHGVYEELIGFKARSPTSIKETKVLPYIARLKLPYIENIPLEKLVELRYEEQDSFLDFRLSLEKMCEEVKVSKASEIATATQQIFEKDIDPKIRGLEREFSRIRKQALIRGIPRAMLASGTLIASVSAGIPFLSALGSIAFLKLFKDVADEYAEYLNQQLKMKRNSMYFLWKAERISSPTERKEHYTTDGFPEKIKIDPKIFAEKMKGLGISAYENVLWEGKTE